MGLLDDAIREHLELKRSRGADPNEVERQERLSEDVLRYLTIRVEEHEEGPSAMMRKADRDRDRDDRRGDRGDRGDRGERGERGERRRDRDDRRGREDGDETPEGASA